MRILLVRTSALGDIVHSLPVLSALRRHLPEARIGWVVEEAFAPLLAAHPDLDAVLPVGLRSWRRRVGSATTWREVSRGLRALRAFRADVALDLMGNHKGAILGLLSGARRRIGLARGARREPSSVLWNTQTARPRGVHAVERSLGVLERLGVRPEPIDFGGDRLLAAHPRGPLPEGPFALLHPGAGWGNKVYPAERWGVVARELRRRTGLATRVALPPSPPERALAARVVECSDGAATSIDAADLATLAALSRRARLVLGGDSGPLHLAHALGAAVLCVMGPTDPASHGPYGHPERALARVLPCSFCYRRFDSTKACLLEVRPEDVVERAAAILLDSRPAR